MIREVEDLNHVGQVEKIVQEGLVIGVARVASTFFKLKRHIYRAREDFPSPCVSLSCMFCTTVVSLGWL
jgi:hypothetical protein